MTWRGCSRVLSGRATAHRPMRVHCDTLLRSVRTSNAALHARASTKPRGIGNAPLGPWEGLPGYPLDNSSVYGRPSITLDAAPHSVGFPRNLCESTHREGNARSVRRESLRSRSWPSLPAR